MLINTVILFLRDALPIFVLLGILLAQVPLTHLRLLLALGLGLGCSLVFIQQVDVLGEMFSGTGLELSLWTMHLMFYCLVLMIGYGLFLAPNSAFNRHNRKLAFLSIVLIIVAKGTNFLLYFNGFLSQQNALQSMLIGTLLGLGICLSLAILLYFFMTWLSRLFGQLATWLVLLIFAAGQLVNALNLLVQVDLIPAYDALWDSQWLLDNESEYGHLFNVLFGYLATPTLLQIFIYAASIILPLTVYFCWTHLLYPARRGQNI